MEKQQKMERLNEEAKQEERESGKREVEGERRREKNKKTCLKHLPSQAFGEHGSAPKWRVLGLPVGLLGVCLVRA